MVQFGVFLLECIVQEIVVVGEWVIQNFCDVMMLFVFSDLDFVCVMNEVVKLVEVLGVCFFCEFVEVVKIDMSLVVDYFVLFVIFNCLSCVNSQVKNICEQIFFVVSGEIKVFKIYWIFFVDEKDNVYIQFVKVYCLRVYFESVCYFSVGWNLVEMFELCFKFFFEVNGYDIVVVLLGFVDFEVGFVLFDVVVVFLFSVFEELQFLFFWMMLIEWDFGEWLDVFDQDCVEVLLWQVYEEFIVQVCVLFEML